MDLSDKLVTTSGEKESHDFPFSSREASLQCGQNLHPLTWLDFMKYKFHQNGPNTPTQGKTTLSNI